MGVDLGLQFAQPRPDLRADPGVAAQLVQSRPVGLGLELEPLGLGESSAPTTDAGAAPRPTAYRASGGFTRRHVTAVVKSAVNSRRVAVK